MRIGDEKLERIRGDVEYGEHIEGDDIMGMVEDLTAARAALRSIHGHATKLYEGAPIDRVVVVRLRQKLKSVAYLAAIALGLAACHVDEWGVRGTRVQLDDMARARVDGSLACADVLSHHSAVNAFDIACTYEQHGRQCRCTVETSTRFQHPVQYTAPVVSFHVRLCEQVWAEGVTFPGMDPESLAREWEATHTPDERARAIRASSTQKENRP